MSVTMEAFLTKKETFGLAFAGALAVFATITIIAKTAFAAALGEDEAILCIKAV
jgi:hypothetical protein